jgi:hypothetical protein
MAASDSTREQRDTDRSQLVSTLVVYTDRADRRTVYPPGTSSVARLSTWLTADDDAFVDLNAVR